MKGGERKKKRGGGGGGGNPCPAGVGKSCWNMYQGGGGVPRKKGRGMREKIFYKKTVTLPQKGGKSLIGRNGGKRQTMEDSRGLNRRKKKESAACFEMGGRKGPVRPAKKGKRTRKKKANSAPKKRENNHSRKEKKGIATVGRKGRVSDKRDSMTDEKGRFLRAKRVDKSKEFSMGKVICTAVKKHEFGEKERLGDGKRSCHIGVSP